MLAIAAGLALPAGGCATTAASAASRAAAGPSVAAAADDDVVALKERVTRLERRLADVDAKLGLLLAQRTHAPRGPGAITHGTLPDLGPRDLIIDEPSDEASLGARPGTRSLDLGSRRSIYDEAGPDLAAEGELIDDDSAPVVIKLHGSPDPTPSAGGLGMRVGPGVGPNVGPSGDGGPPPGSTVEESYAWAQQRLKEGRHLEAIAALEEILARHGGHNLADNALYWTAWAHAQRGDHQIAVDVWQRLPMRFPKSAKVADALFGMAVSHEAMGEPAVAETLYEQLVSQYPRAEKVREARAALRRLRPR